MLADRTTGKQDIDKSTLMALLLYLDMNKQEPEFFSYVKRTLEKKNDPTITKDMFTKMFLDPDISFKNLTNENMAQVIRKLILFCRQVFNLLNRA